MSVTPNQIILYGSMNMPESDGSAVGGAVDFLKRVTFFEIPMIGTVDVVSSSAADTATKVQVSGRDASGTVVSPAAITMTGTTLIPAAFGGQQFERLMAGVTSGAGPIAGLSNPGGTPALGDVAVMFSGRTVSNHIAQGAANASGVTPPTFTLQAGDAGATLSALSYAGLALIIYLRSGTGAGQLRSITAQYTGVYGADVVAVNRDWSVLPDATTHYDLAGGFLFDILPNQVRAITRCFATAAADIPGGSTRVFYEKIFAVNTNAATALQAAALEILTENPTLPSGALLDFALTKTLNDTATTANRQTLPLNGDASALTFVPQPTFIPVIAPPGSLPNGNSFLFAQGLWLRLTLPPGIITYKGAADIRCTGTTV